MLTLVVPVYNHLDLTDQFLSSIQQNTIIPDQVILIDDNSVEDIKNLVKKYSNLPIRYIRHDRNQGVNYAWNEGLSLAETKYVSIFNNDLILNKIFFSSILRAFESNSNYGIVCGERVRDLANLKVADKSLIEEEPLDLQPIAVKKNGEVSNDGYAFTLRRDFAVRLDPIPANLKFFYGDNYFYLAAKHLNYKAIRVLNAKVIHLGHTTVNEMVGGRYSIMGREGRFWTRCRRSLLAGHHFDNNIEEI